MTCITPPPLDEDTISTVIDGVADADTRAHLDDCVHCRSLVERAAHTEAMLALRLHRWACPPPDALRDYHFTLLNEAEHDKVAEHLEACSTCRAELSHLRRFIERGRTAPDDDRTRLSFDPAGTLRELIASLVPRSQPAYALRGDVPKPVMAQAEDVTLFIEIQPGGVGFTLNGQVTAADMAEWQGALVQIVRGKEHIAAARVDDGGMFSTTPIEPGTLTVRITSEAGRVVVLPDLEPTV